VIDYLVGYSRVLAGGRCPFDEAAVRELARSDVERARNSTAAQNHGVVPDDALRHGEALADAIPGARLLPLEGAGHGVDRADSVTIVRAILEHTSSGA